jgi:hypothetical protein
MSSDPTGLFLVLSNIAAIPAISYALYRRLWPEASILTIIAVVSFFYHLCQSDYWCIVTSDCQNNEFFAIMQTMDEFFVFIAVIWFIMYFFEIRLNYRISFTFILQSIIFIPILKDISLLIFEVVIVVIVILASIIVLFFIHKKALSFYIFSTLVAICLIAVGFSLFIIAGDPGDSQYPWIHPVWHILLFFGALFIIDMKYGITDSELVTNKNITRLFIHLDFFTIK